jgi:diguanylate cyclase (GGDEF)-like protein
MNRTLDELASRDGLTRLQNRRSLTKSVADDHGRLRGDCWLGFIDLDRFKDINDTLGHAIGDLVLITVAERWSRLLPQSAMLARTGGDEFALFIPDATAEDALELSPATHRRVDRTDRGRS